ncbi:hypothetical protein AB0J85_11715 [Micromonospora echinofusca]|uniref:hypothetical protein n=1 Tax=Micromonospora echinofusca TaxID=47858 RepID=UPI003428EE63
MGRAAEPGELTRARGQATVLQGEGELKPYEEPEGLDADVEVLRFVFRTLTTPLDELPRHTVLQRAIVDHLKAGRHWRIRRGRFPF